MRARYRAQVREDVKAVALEQLASGSPAAISMNAIARRLGVSGPALYRYFANRDELLAELVIDTYHDFAEALALAVGGETGPDQRLRALASGWRAFARAQPHRYSLLFGPPVPGYDAHSGPLVTASRRAMAVGLDVVAGLDRVGATGPDPLDRILPLWCRVHGFVVLELGGNFASMGVDADDLFQREIDAFLGGRAVGEGEVAGTRGDSTERDAASRT